MKMSSVVLVYLERDSELMWSEEEGDSIRFIILTENEWLLQRLLPFRIDSTILLRRSGGGRGDRPIKGLGIEGGSSQLVCKNRRKRPITHLPSLSSSSFSQKTEKRKLTHKYGGEREKKELTDRHVFVQKLAQLAFRSHPSEDLRELQT